MNGLAAGTATELDAGAAVGVGAGAAGGASAAGAVLRGGGDATVSEMARDGGAGAAEARGEPAGDEVEAGLPVVVVIGGEAQGCI